MSTVAIIGAGAAGITAAKSLVEEGFNVSVFERNDDIGGQWHYGPNSGVWDSLHANTSKKITCFSDFPFDDTLPHFVHHKQMKEYFRKYVNHFKFSDRIFLNHKVESCVYDENKKWKISIRNTKNDTITTDVFDYLVSTTGRYTSPATIDMDFTPFIKKGGKLLNAQQFRTPMTFANQKVLVIGGSFSGVDIALNLISTATSVVLSVRSSYWIIEKRIGGKIYDEAICRRNALAIPPEKYIPAVVETLKSVDANPGKHGGIPASENLFTETCLAIGVGFNDALLDGKIKERPSVKYINPDGSVTFEDGHVEDFDSIILAVGYKVSLPYLPQEIQSQIIDEKSNYVKLFHWTFHPSIPNLAVLGQYKSLAAYNPQLELQGRWISYVWKGIRTLPSEEEMKKWIGDVLVPFENTRFPLRAHHTIMEDFATLAGVVPVPENNPDIKDLLFDGLLVGALYRLDGHGSKKEESTELIKKWNKEFQAY